MENLVANRHTYISPSPARIPQDGPFSLANGDSKTQPSLKKSLTSRFTFKRTRVSRSLARKTWLVESSKMRTTLRPVTCAYCLSPKHTAAFPSQGSIPKSCRPHLLNWEAEVVVCTDCIRDGLAAQLRTTGRKAFGCPDCRQSWGVIFLWLNTPKHTRKILLRQLLTNIGSRQIKSYQPPDEHTLKLLVQQNSRLCPHCGWVFQHVTGCAHMFCTHCAKDFNLRNSVYVKDARSTVW